MAGRVGDGQGPPGARLQLQVEPYGAATRDVPCRRWLGWAAGK